MAPTRLQYIVAKDLPGRILSLLAVIAGVAVAIIAGKPSRQAFADWNYCLLFFLSVLIAPVLFFMLSVPLDLILFGSIYAKVERLNGAPFQVGERVRILRGPHRDRVARIYATWDSRRQVRVDLGIDSNLAVTDVFSYTQVSRETKAQPDARPGEKPGQ